MKNREKIFISAMVMTCICGGYTVLPALATSGATQLVAQKEDSLCETEEWQSVENKWNSQDKVEIESFEGIPEIVDREKQDMRDLLGGLVSKGYFSEITADAINMIYGENLRSLLEGKVILPCCYAPMPPPPEWDCRGVDTREELEKKLAIVEDLYGKGTVEKETLDLAKKDIQNRISLLDEADACWQGKGEGTYENHPEEVDLLLHFYDRNAGGIKDGKDVVSDLIKAAEYIVILEK